MNVVFCFQFIYFLSLNSYYFLAVLGLLATRAFSLAGQ